MCLKCLISFFSFVYVPEMPYAVNVCHCFLHSLYSLYGQAYVLLIYDSEMPYVLLIMYGSDATYLL